MRIIAHLDMDAFFAAVEERDKPHLKGRPIVVGADPRDGKGRGVVATANYAARAYGIRSAMPIQEAWMRAEAGRKKGGPEVAWVFPRGGRYGEVSRRIMSIVARRVKLMEQTSVDEAYLDLSFAGSFAAAAEICRKLQKDVEAETGLTASIGVGPNKLIAKIASDRQKPKGLTVVGHDYPDECARQAEEFLESLSIRAIPGIGPKTETALVRRNIILIRDLKKFTKEEMEKEFGSRGHELYSRIRGRDDAELVFEYEPKSVGEQTTFEEDSREPQFLLAEIKKLCEGTFRAFRAEGFAEFQKVVLLIRFNDFTTVSRGRTLDAPGRTEEEVEFQAMRLFMPFLDQRENPRGRAFRLLGVRLEKLARESTQSLF